MQVLQVFIPLLVVFTLVVAQKYPCHRALRVDITDGMKINDTIHHNNVIYPKGQYFKELNKIKGCLCNVHACIRKCCPFGEAHDGETCVPTNHTISTNFSVPVYVGSGKVDWLYRGFKYIIGSYCARDGYILDTTIFPEDFNYLQKNGSLIMPLDDSHMKLPHDFCFDINATSKTVQYLTIVCFPKQPTDQQKLDSIALEKDGALPILGGPSSLEEPIPPQEPNPTQIPEVVNSHPENPITCTNSQTTINGGQVVCSGTLLFEDHFSTGYLNSTLWTREQYVAEGPVRNTPDSRNGVAIAQYYCTGKLCSVSVTPQANFLPPIVAAKIKSTFSFLYGKVEIRAQLPKGDWIVPQVNLDPPGQFSYEKGRLWVAYARGNQDLRRHETEEQIGNSVLYAGGVLGQGEPLRTHAALRVAGEGGWGDAFHVYTMVWAPDGIKILVDGKEKGTVNPPYSSSSDGAPFNKEFVISLGIAAGGYSDFPERSTSNGNRMSWKKLSVRPMANFYRSKDQWYPTWAGDNSVLKIDYVKVWAL